MSRSSCQESAGIYPRQRLNISLFSIDAAYQLAQDRAEEYAAEHNGEILPEFDTELTALEMDRDKKIDCTIRYYKNQLALADMIEAELDALKSRIKVHRNNAERNKNYLGYIIQPGQKLEYGCGKISWRKSERVEVQDINALPESFVKVERSAMLTEIKAALKQGIILPARIVEMQNIQVK